METKHITIICIVIAVMKIEETSRLCSIFKVNSFVFDLYVLSV